MVLCDKNENIAVGIAYNSYLHDVNYKGALGGASSCPSVDVAVSGIEYWDSAFFIIAWGDAKTRLFPENILEKWNTLNKI